MVRLIIDITEEKQKKFDNVLMTSCNVELTEIREGSTRVEKECSQILRKRMGAKKDGVIIFENKCKSEKAIDELLKKILD